MSFNRYQPLPAIGGQSDNELTNYRNDYKQHQMERPYVHPAEQYVKPVGDMENKTSYKNDYTGMLLFFLGTICTITACHFQVLVVCKVLKTCTKYSFGTLNTGTLRIELKFLL